MGLTYDCLVYPAAGHVAFFPRPKVVGEVVEGLMETGWIARRANLMYFQYQREGKPAKNLTPKSLRGSDVAAVVAKGAGSFAFAFQNERDKGDPTPFERDRKGVFRAAHCETVYLGASQHPLLVEDRGHPDDSVPCPRCGKEATIVKYERSTASGAGLFMGAQSFLPESCQHCAAPLDPEAMSMILHAAADRKVPASERAPFFRFVLYLLPVESRTPRVKSIPLDPSLPELLQKVCGVPFRSYGKLGWS